MITVDPNKICYIFDVDGTLTEPREEMNQSFANEFLFWSMGKQCYISTGSDFQKTKQQVPWDVLDCFKSIFCCMGNEVRNSIGNIIHKSEFTLPDSLEQDLAVFLQNTAFPYKTGNHIEPRTGMVNFSIVGRNATQEQRKEYSAWDNANMERANIAEFINQNYPALDATVGGSISIDIIEFGQDKGQTIHYLENAGATKIVFVGDKCELGGNDHGIIRELEKSNLSYDWYNVKGPEDTLSLIRTNKVFGGGR
jgi:phosphomannomutase